MKFTSSALALVLFSFVSVNAFAESGFIICSKNARSVRSSLLQVKASGSIDSHVVPATATEAEKVIFDITFDSIQLYSDTGRTAGTRLQHQVFSVEGSYEGDYLTLDLPVTDQNPLLKSISLDLSAANRGATRFVTQRGNSYRSDCQVSWIHPEL
jgi:hypothetical protein